MFEENTKELLSIPVEFRPDFESNFAQERRFLFVETKMWIER